MSSIAKILEENPHLQPVFDELTYAEKVQLDKYLAEPRMAEGFATKNTKLGRVYLESNKYKSMENKLNYARSQIKAILTDPEFRYTITHWKSLMPEDEPEPFNESGSPVRVAKVSAAPPPVEERLPAYMMPRPAPRQRRPPQLNFNNNKNNKNNNNEPNRKKSKKTRKSKRKTRKN